MSLEGIAVIGITAQLPSGSMSSEDLDYESLWNLLVRGANAYESLDEILLKGTSQQKVKLPTQGTFLKNAQSFDNISLGISVRDARVIPFSGRRLLDMSFQALLDAGIDSRGKKIGCFMSANLDRSAIDTDGSCSWMPHTVANRVSYALNLTGPSFYVDTACSSSLTALHLAIGAIERGDCSAAVVGAAQINRDPVEWDNYVRAALLSPDGTCKPFDERADGFARGEGVVVVVLKPLQDALRDNDHVYSVVVGSAINATGSLSPVNVPNGAAQQQCIYEAYKRASLQPQEADYVELHATGTSVGDPIETNAAGLLFSTNVSVNFGSIKGNIGHLEVAAFLASLLKACLIFEHQTIPPTVNFSSPALAINWDDFNVTVPVNPVALGCRSSSGRSTISLSAAGIGGATGHVVVQSPPILPPAQPKSSTTPVLFIVGGLSSNVVAQISQAALLLDTSKSGQYAVTLSRRARQLPWRTHFNVPLSSSAVIPPATLVPNEPPSIAFVFSGQGPQNFDMGRQLFCEYPVFQKTILELDDVYRRIKGVSLVESTGLFTHLGFEPSITLSDLAWPVAITLPAIAMVQIAFFDLLKSVNVVPEMMWGHSAGETAILYCCGAGSKEMAMEIAIARGESMTYTESPEVGMAMLTCSADHATNLIAYIAAQSDGVLDISCFNTPDSIAVSGSALLLDQLVALAKSQGLFAQRIRTWVPGHSSLMDCIRDDYYARMHDIFSRYPGPHTPRIQVFSTCQEQILVETFTVDYFWDNCRNPVQFSDAVSHSLTLSPVFLEISCHPVLSSSIVARGVPDSRVLCPMRRLSARKTPPMPSSEPEILLDTLGRLSLLGINSLDLSGLYGFSSLKSKLIAHPLTPRAISPPKSLFPQLFPRNDRPLSCSNLRIHSTTHPDFAEHVINGEAILPATGFIELLLESGANFVWDMDFISILSLASGSPLEVCLQRMDSQWRVTTNTAIGEQEHVRGCMDRSDPPKLPPAVDLSSLWASLPPLDLTGFYAFLQPLASYGPRFQRVVRCHGGPLEAITEIKGPTADELAPQYLLHPVIMDACMHVTLHPGISKEYSKDVIYLPSRVDHFVFYRREYDVGNWFSYIHLRRWTPECRYYDVLVTDAHGLALCQIQNLVVRKFTSAASFPIERRFDLIFQPAGVLLEVPRVGKAFPECVDKHEILLLFDILDSLAVEMIYKSLEHNLVVGTDESRLRYVSFARRALAGQKKGSFTGEVVQNLRNKWPHHFEVTDRIASIHDSVFESPKRAVETLYSDGLMADFYLEYGRTSNACVEAARAFSEVLESLRTSGKRSLKILECGAGTGSLTRHIVDELKRNPDLLAEYTLTDISYSLVANLARRLSYDFLIPKAYDISKDPAAQDIHSNSYDIVVALHALHAAPNVETCLESLRNILVPGGCLLIVELDGTAWVETSGSTWFDCIFGSFPEWFGYADGRDHCTMAPVLWKSKLEALEFVNVQTCIDDGGSGRDFFFVAQKSIAYPVSDLLVDPRHIYTYRFGAEFELQNNLRVHDPTSSFAVNILALQGRDADAAVGLCATLRKEFVHWNVRLWILESVAHIADPITLISQYASTGGGLDNVVFLDRDGLAHVSRLVLSSSPSNPASLPRMHGRRSAFEDLNFIDLRINHWAGISASYDGFIGQLVSTHQSETCEEILVGGLAEKCSDQILRVPISNVVRLSNDSAATFPEDILSAILISCIHSHPCSSPNVRVAIAFGSRDFADLIRRRVSRIPHVEMVLADFTAPDRFQLVDLMFTDSHIYSQHRHLRRWITRSGQLLLWDDLVKAKILHDPSYLPRALAKPGETSPDYILPSPSIRRDLNGDFTFGAAPPFRPDHAYILLGGIGGLGVDLAIWLYEHGARHIVLTSRRGLASLDHAVDAISLAKIAYLRSQEAVDLRLELCDATDRDAMHSLLRNLSIPIAGCFHMTLVLRDVPFLQQTRETFNTVHDSKMSVFENFSAEVAINSLDFFVAFSSISGLLGITGQSNYASACTALNGALAHYPNAFSLITPGISDVGYLDRMDSNLMERKQALGSMTAKTLWKCLEDGLRKLDEGPFNQYIPDLNWSLIDAQFGLPVAYRHLMPSNYAPTIDSQETKSAQNTQNAQEEILLRVLHLLEVSAGDFDATQPLIIYGLDSISAAGLSAILQPYAFFSQMQLLGGTTWADIAKEIESASQAGDLVALGDPKSATDTLLSILGVSPADFSGDIPLSSYGLDSLGAAQLANALQPFITVTQMQLMGQMTWDELLQLPRNSPPASGTQCLVEISSGPGTPLIILPGANGSIAHFSGLRRHFHGPIWAIQITYSTPLDSLAGLVAFWKDQICEKRPDGPYRVAAYSASALAGVLLTKLMEDAGEEVLQLAFLENCPALWMRQEAEALLREGTMEEFRDVSAASVLDMLKNDRSTGTEAVANYEAALLGLPSASSSALAEVRLSRTMFTLIFRFLEGFYPAGARSYNAYIGPYTNWLFSVNAPLLILIAEHGVLHSIPGGAWPDLGASLFDRTVTVHYLRGLGHFGLWADDSVGEILKL